MYHCSLCGKVTPAGAARQLIVIYKETNHPFRQKVGKNWQIGRNGRPKLDWYDDPGGVGKQIEKEYPVCMACKQEHEARDAP